MQSATQTIAEAIAHTISEMEVRLSPNGIRSMQSHARMFTGLWGDLLMTQLVIVQARDQGATGEATQEVTRRLAEFRAAYLEAMKAYASSPDAPADLWEVGD